MITAITKIYDAVNSRNDKAIIKFNKFVSNLSGLSTPEYAMTRSMGAFEAAATMQVASEIAHMIAFAEDTDSPVESVIESLYLHALNQVSTRSRYSESSSSETSNLMERAILREWGYILEIVSREMDNR